MAEPTLLLLLLLVVESGGGGGGSGMVGAVVPEGGAAPRPREQRHRHALPDLHGRARWSGRAVASRTELEA